MKEFFVKEVYTSIICIVLSVQLSAQNFRSAEEIAADMTIGWNIGNSMEALYEYNGDIVADETAWGNPVITESLIQSVKAAGFNTIRIPVAWDVHATNNVIDAAWIARVKEVVDYCIQNDMYAIINIHWDYGWLEENCTQAMQASVNVKQEAYWTQIANYFKDYDEHLLFASANEPNVDDATQMAVLLSYHQTFIDVVRSTGGNNSQRTLIVQGPSTDTEKTSNLMNTLPTDPVADRMMVEVHYYSPYQYCLMTQDETWGNQFYTWGECFHSTTDTDHNPTWGEEDFLDQQFQNMKTKFIDQGYPVIVGEFGVNTRKNLTGDAYDLHVASREYYYRYITKAAKRYGLVLVYWDAGFVDTHQFTLFDRNTGAIVVKVR
ncbi:MAG: glycoside hydrolase family 5 protein [Bacteroidales bacterium]|jgi:endoglucanase|nr:glycoside hydrolase family 5 protein [Bacteroidales bacterium]